MSRVSLPWRPDTCLVFLSLGLLAPAPIAGVQDASTMEVLPVRSIGVLEGDSRLEFGHLIEMAADEERGVVFLLDRLNARLSVFTHGGEFVAATGRQGSGPGEFRYAGALAGEGSTVHVFDPANLRISTYAFRDDSLVLTAERRVPLEGRDMCVLGDAFYVLKYRNGTLVHRVDAEGEVITSFGRPFRNGDPVMASLTDFGHITCDSVSRSVFITASSTPTVRRYTATGELLWEATVPGLAPSTITRNDRGGVTWSPPPDRDNYDRAVSLVVLPGGRLLVQFGQTFPEMSSSEDIVEVTSVVFDVEDGTMLATRDDLPRIDFATTEHAYSHANDPYPRVIVYEWR